MSILQQAPVATLVDGATARYYYDQLLEITGQPLLSSSDRVAKLRTVADRLFQAFTSGERRQFSDFYSRVNFVFQTVGGDAALRRELHALRQLANDVIHRGVQADEYQYRLGVKVLLEVVYLYSGVEPPRSLRQGFGEAPGQLGRVPKRTAGALHTFLRACVLHVGEAERGSRGLVFRRIVFAEAESGRRLTLTCWNDPAVAARRLADQAGLLWPYATVHLFRLRALGDQDDAFSTTGASVVVLEPDYLVEASELAECFQRSGPDVRLYLLSRLVGSSTNAAAFTGKIVNSLLDALMLDPAADLREAYQRCIEDNLLTALQFGEEEIQKIRKDIFQQHYEKLVQTARRYHGQPLRIEPTFFSARFGLQGRLDALVEAADDPLRKDVFELKSGKCPSYDVWLNHKMQVVGYHLLLRSVFGEERRGNSAIFYSKAAGETLRNVAVDTADEQQLIALRNEVVHQLYRLADQRFDILQRMTPEQSPGYPPFKLEPVAMLATALQEASDLERAYFHAFLGFLIRELIAAKTGADDPERSDRNGFAGLWLDGLPEKREQFAILEGLVFEAAESAGGELAFAIDHDGLSTFREGDIGIIYPQDADGLRPLRYQILKCRIVKLEARRVRIRLRNPQVDLRVFGEGRRWALEHDFYETNFNGLTQSLVAFLAAPREKRELILGLRAPRFTHRPVEGDYDLTPGQAALLRRALSADDYFLLQGPPGTGKTSRLLVSLVAELVRAPERSVAVLAFTNRAVEEICDKLKKRGVAFIRLGGSGRETEQHLAALANGRSPAALRALLQAGQVFVSTVSSFQMRQADLFRLKNFDTLIVDEASQLIEPQLVGLLPHFQRFILIGDHHQLPAVVVQKARTCQVELPALRAIGLLDLRQSLFERLYTHWEGSDRRPAEKPVGMLRDHFRMHEDIARLVNPYYGGRLAPTRKEQRWQRGFFHGFGGDALTQRLTRSRTVFIPSPREGATKVHREEARRVVALLRRIRRLAGAAFDERTVGVITPWRAQIAEIKRQLAGEPELLDRVAIDTVERFQGSERRIILLSLAVSSPTQLRALESISPREKVDRKLNVAISRAEEHLIVLGCAAVLRSSRFYGAVLEAIEQGGGLLEWEEAGEP